MSSGWKLHTYPNNSRAFKALIAAEYGGLQIETPQFQMGKDNKSKDFLAKFPTGKVPALETPQGNVFESNAIARHVARHVSSKHNLLGRSELEQGQVDQWIDFCAGEIDLPAAAWLYPIFKIVPLHKEATEKAKADIKKTLLLLHNHLNTRTFLVGERISLADIVVAMSLHRLYVHVLEPAFRKPFGNVTRWFTTIVNQPQVRKVVGDVVLCAKMEVAPEPPKVESKPEQQQQQQPKPAAKEQQQPKKPEAASAAGTGEEEEESKPKKRNPLDSLPKSKLEMDEWKRTYSNTQKIKTEAMPWFWSHYDPEGYCIYYSVYKYNDELTALFKTANLVGGFLQRLDALRKYGFGSVLIFGDDEEAPTKFEISGVWLFRGTTIPPEMSENEEAAHHEFRKLELNEADKKLVGDYWAWEGDFGGKTLKCLQGKTFK